MNIPGGDSGWIIGGGGSNIQRIETKTKVDATNYISSDWNYSLLTTGNTEEMRQAAATDIIRGFKVTMECSNLTLFYQISNNMKLIAESAKF